MAITASPLPRDGVAIRGVHLESGRHFGTVVEMG